MTESERLRDVMESRPGLCRGALLDALEAIIHTATRVVFDKTGRMRQVPDWGVRLRAIQEAHALRDAYPAAQAVLTGQFHIESVLAQLNATVTGEVAGATMAALAEAALGGSGRGNGAEESESSAADEIGDGALARLGRGGRDGPAAPHGA